MRSTLSGPPSSVVCEVTVAVARADLAALQAVVLQVLVVQAVVLRVLVVQPLRVQVVVVIAGTVVVLLLVQVP